MNFFFDSLLPHKILMLVTRSRSLLLFCKTLQTDVGNCKRLKNCNFYDSRWLLNCHRKWRRNQVNSSLVDSTHTRLVRERVKSVSKAESNLITHITTLFFSIIQFNALAHTIPESWSFFDFHFTVHWANFCCELKFESTPDSLTTRKKIHFLRKD